MLYQIIAVIRSWESGLIHPDFSSTLWCLSFVISTRHYEISPELHNIREGAVKTAAGPWAVPTHVATGGWSEEHVGDGEGSHTNADAFTHDASKHTSPFPLWVRCSLSSDAVSAHATYPVWASLSQGRLAAEPVPAHLIPFIPSLAWFSAINWKPFMSCQLLPLNVDIFYSQFEVEAVVSCLCDNRPYCKSIGFLRRKHIWHRILSISVISP